MLRFVVFTTLVATALAGGYGSGGYGGMGGGSYGGGSSYGGSQGGYSSGGYGGSGGYSSGGSSYGGGVVTGAVQSRRSVSFYDVPSTYSNAQPLTIDLPSGVQPLNFRFSSRSSPINIESHHEGSQGSYQETSSTDEPHVRVHTVTRPLVQKLNEIITPYRQIRQEVRPVQETVEQVVARGQEQQSYGGYGGSSYGGNQGGYSSGGYGSGGQGGYSMGGGYGGY